MFFLRRNSRHFNIEIYCKSAMETLFTFRWHRTWKCIFYAGWLTTLIPTHKLWWLIWFYGVMNICISPSSSLFWLYLSQIQWFSITLLSFSPPGGPLLFLFSAHPYSSPPGNLFFLTTKPGSPPHRQHICFLLVGPQWRWSQHHQARRET